MRDNKVGRPTVRLTDSIIAADHVTYAHYQLTPDWRTLGQYFSRLEKQGLGINLASYVGATQVRRAVLGDVDMQPTPAQLDRMKAVATFENPNQLSVGMQYVLVNGVPVIAEGKMTNALPGKVIRGAGYRDASSGRN